MCCPVTHQHTYAAKCEEKNTFYNDLQIEIPTGEPYSFLVISMPEWDQDQHQGTSGVMYVALMAFSHGQLIRRKFHVIHECS